MNEKFKIIYSAGRVFSEDPRAKTLYDKSRFGEIIGGRVYYSFVESIYLADKGKASIYFLNKKIPAEKFLEKMNKTEKNFLTKYYVYKDLRDRGYIVKTALKFGADFRVYDKGKKPGEEHAKWIVFPVYETKSMTWYEFSAKVRVAHSTKKNLLIGVVDEEGDVSYYEVSWIRP